MEISNQARGELVREGRLRAGINFGNQLLTKRDANTGEPGGIAVELARELGRRLEVPVEIVPYEAAGDLASSAARGEWEVGFLAVEQKRADTISFTAPYVEIESTYMVPRASGIRDVATVDQEGRRIAVSEGSAYDLFLSRTLKHATLVRVRGGAGAFETFVREKLDALAGLKPVLFKFEKDNPDVRILEGSFTSVLQGAGVPKGLDAAAKYLRTYIEDVKTSGFVAEAIRRNGIEGVRVAPPASA